MSAETLTIEWVASPQVLAESSVERKYTHQMQWDMSVAPRKVIVAQSDIVDYNGTLVAPREVAFLSTVGFTSAYCSVEKSSDKRYLSRKKRICLLDDDRDGEFDRYSTANYSSSTQSLALLEGGAIDEIDTAEISPEASPHKLDWRLFVTSGVGQTVRMQLFLGSRDFRRHCYLKNQRIRIDDSSQFECGIPGLLITMRNTSGNRRDRKIELTKPEQEFLVLFSGDAVRFLPSQPETALSEKN